MRSNRFWTSWRVSRGVFPFWVKSYLTKFCQQFNLCLLNIYLFSCIDLYSFRSDIVHIIILSAYQILPEVDTSHYLISLMLAFLLPRGLCHCLNWLWCHENKVQIRTERAKRKVQGETCRQWHTMIRYIWRIKLFC